MSIITNYIIKKIISDSKISSNENTSGRFILKNYPKEIYDSLLEYFSRNKCNEIVILVDESLEIEIASERIIKANHELMAQYRNENVQHSEIDLNSISYIVFITNEVIDTLNDISTLTPDDIKNEFKDAIELIDNASITGENNKTLQTVCNMFFKQVEGLDVFEMEAFVNSVIKYMAEDGYAIADAMGMSLNVLNAFRNRKFFDPIKKNDFNQVDLKKIITPFKKISDALYKRVGNNSLSSDELLEKYEENIEEFDILPQETQTLIKEFIKADSRDLIRNIKKFSNLDWLECSIYRLFEKTKSDTSRLLGQDTIDILEEKDINIDENEKTYLSEYDKLPAKERESLKIFLEPVYIKYRSHIEDNKILRSKWDKFLYPAQSKSDDFILGVLETINKLRDDSGDNINNILVSLKQSQTTAIMRNYSKYAINYLHKRYSILNRISKTIHFDFQFIKDIEHKLTTNEKETIVVQKYKKGSLASSMNELHFIVQARDLNNNKLAERKLIWAFNPNSIMTGYKEDIEAIEIHLINKCLYSNEVYRASGSEKGGKKPLSLFDYTSLDSRGSNQGYRLFPKKCQHKITSKNILKSAKELLPTDIFATYKNYFDNFLEDYSWILKQLDVTENLIKSSFDFDRIKKFSQSYINLCKLLFDNSENDRFKREVIEPFLALITVPVALERSVIIPSYHPLRLISYFVKLKHTFNFLDIYVKSDEHHLIKKDLYFSDLKQNFNTPYYPEVFRLFNVEKTEESLLHISEICDDYTILEPIQNYLESGQSTDPSAQTNILIKVIEDYLDLNNHKQSSLKILLHAVNNYDFPAKLLKKLIASNFVAKENNFEIYLNDVNASHIRKMYRSFLVDQNNKYSEETLEYNEISFLSNIRINAFDQSFKQLENINDQLNIAFINDFVSSKATVEFRKQLLKEQYDLFDYHPTMWSKRRFMTEKEGSVGKYLVSPAKNDLSNSFYNLLYLTMSTHPDDFKDKIPTLKVDRNHKNLHTDLETIHKHTDWVVNLDSLLDKKILEEFGANVIKYRKARHINRNLVISSKANTILLESHLKRKLEDFNVNGSVIKNSIKHIIKYANELSGDILLKAIGRGCHANEMLGLVLTKSILQGCTKDYDNVLIYIDDYQDWFLSNVNSEVNLLTPKTNALADIISITPIFKDKKLTTVYLEIIESKFGNEANRAESAKKSLEQTRSTFELIKKAFDANDYFDKEYWLSKISDLIVENHTKSFKDGQTSEEIRNLIRTDKNINFILRGMSFIFVHDDDRDYHRTTDIVGIDQYIIGSKSIVKLIESLPDFQLVSTEFTWPNYESNPPDKQILLTDKKENKVAIFENIEVHKDELTVKTEPENKITNNNLQIDAESLEAEALENAVKRVVMHHGYRAKILNTLFTPNSVRISLGAEMGWNESIFYKMKNDFLAVEKLSLQRVEVIPGAYDLIFQRIKRQIIFYQDCLINREFTTNFGNTKILLGRNEENNDVVYYDLDSEDPHALIGGMTKSGKSVLLNIFIVDLMRTNKPTELKLILIDPKQVEFTRYKKIPYLDKDGIITNKDLAIQKLDEVVDEMERRYAIFTVKGINNLNKYNDISNTKLPRIVLIFDEFADWMLDEKFKSSATEAIQRLSGKARAAGIHLIVSTQRPDNTVVPPILRSNLGAKFGLRVDSDKNSVIIIGEAGAEKLLGYGHMIVKFAGKKQYIQSAFISDNYIDSVLTELNCL